MRTWKHPGGFGFAGLSPERVGACLCGFVLGAWEHGQTDLGKSEHEHRNLRHPQRGPLT